MHNPVQELANIDIDICQVRVLGFEVGILAGRQKWLGVWIQLHYASHTTCILSSLPCRILERAGTTEKSPEATWMEATDGDWERRCLHRVSQSAIVQARSLSTKHPKNTTPGGKCQAWMNVNSAD